MPTRIFFSNGDQMTVSDEVDAVAQVLGQSGFAKLDRPWGDSSVFVNPAAVLYIEMQDERSPDIEAMQAVPTPPAPPAAGPSPAFPQP